MMTIAEVGEALITALRTVPNLRAGFVSELTDPAPPAALVQPPVLSWAGYRDGPTSATFEVAVCVAFDDRAMERLYELVPLVANALEEVADAAVTEARPGTFRVGSAELPCYSITVETSL
jgi:hypothetical protein